MKILGEMKRRNVLRIGMTYIVAGWLLVQLGYILAGDFNAPAWVMGLVVTFVVVGFPIAMFFAWTFAFTDQGIRKETDLRVHDHLVRKRGHKLDAITMALLAAVVGMMLMDKYLPQPPGSEQPVTTVQPYVEPGRV